MATVRPLIDRHLPPYTCGQCFGPLTAGKTCWRCDVPEAAWTEGGLRHVVICNRIGIWSGYVEVPEDHVWHGLDLTDEAPVVGDPPLYDLSLPEAMESVGILNTGFALFDGPDGVNRFARTLTAQVRVAGGLSFADWAVFHGEPIRYYLGFHAAHGRFKPDVSRMDPVVAELIEPLIDKDAHVFTPEEMRLECRRLAASIREAWIGH